MAATNSTVLELADIRRSFGEGATRLDVLTGATMTLGAGEIAALVAPSGAGKSTLLHIAGLLERPSGGEVLIGGEACGRLSDKARTALRRARLGFVYQFHHLLPEFSARENVALPQMIAGRPRAQADERADELLGSLGLGGRLGHRPTELSGGEQQRVAIARAVANGPGLILADEPTGNLDPKTADMVFDAMLRLVRDEGAAALIATHNPDLAARMDRVLAIEDGRIIPQ